MGLNSVLLEAFRIDKEIRELGFWVLFAEEHSLVSLAKNTSGLGITTGLIIFVKTI